MSKLAKHAYKQLVEQDIAWLLANTARCLERDHIESVLRGSVDLLYQPQQQSQSAPAESAA